MTKQKPEIPFADRCAYKLLEFCGMHGLTRSQYYQMPREERPVEMSIGSTGIRISFESAADWRRRMEAKAKAKAAELEDA